MIVILFFVVLALVLLVIVWSSTDLDLVEKLMGSIVVLILGATIGTASVCIICPFTGGLFEGYSEGDRVGYVTKLSKKGIIFKTNEGEMQLGSGNMSALQEPFEFSVTANEILNQLDNAVLNGKKVKLSYIEWLISPAWVGKTGHIITNLKILDEPNTKTINEE